MIGKALQIHHASMRLVRHPNGCLRPDELMDLLGTKRNADRASTVRIKFPFH